MAVRTDDDRHHRRYLAFEASGLKARSENPGYRHGEAGVEPGENVAADGGQVKRVSPAGNVEAVMRALARAIDWLELPAVEKIRTIRKRNPFQVLIATLLSARTQDATTLGASTGCSGGADAPPPWKLTVAD